MTHVNALPFQGILTFVDVASEAAPAGARGHRVILTRQAAERALPTLIGMGVNWAKEFHHQADKCGVILEAVMMDDAIVVSGCLWVKDKKSDVLDIQASAEPLGMSYEVADALVEDLRADIWLLKRVTFTGACIIPLVNAAYKRTTFDIINR